MAARRVIPFPDRGKTDVAPPPQRSLALSPLTGEFLDQDAESAFLRATWPASRFYVVRAAYLAGAVFVLFGVADLARLGATEAVLGMTAIRFAVFALGVAVATLIARPPHALWAGAAMTGLFWTMCLSMMGIAEVRGAIAMTYIAGVLGIVLAQYLFVPVRLYVALTSALAMSATAFAYGVTRDTADIIDSEALGGVLSAANLLGLALTLTLNRVRRRDFTVLLAEETTNAALRRRNAELEATLARAAAERARIGDAEALGAVAGALPVGLLLTDRDGRAITWNAAFADLLGPGAEPRRGQSADDLRQALQQRSDPSQVGDPLATADAVAPYDAEVELVLADGRTLVRSAAPVALPDGRTGVAWIFQDVTAERRTLGVLSAERDRAAAGMAAKSAFLAMVSHELRTPLGGIMGMIRLLEESRLSANQRALVEASSHSGEVMLAVLDDLLEFNRLESAVLDIAAEPFDLRQTVESVGRLFAHRAAEKGVTLTVEVAESVPARVIGDANRLRQVLMNLTLNAVKFTAHGSIVIRIRRDPDRFPGGALLFEVRDTGIGMDPAVLDRVFDPFFQVAPHDAAVGRVEGTGLGLAICRRLVELQGGRIGVESRKNEGSRFWFLLPLATAPAADHGDRDAPLADDEEDGFELPPLKVLAVDDNAVNQRLVTTLLEARGHRVTTAEDGAHAVAAARLGGYDLLILDLRMPSLGGLEAAALIRSLPAPEGRVPIVLLSAGMEPAVRREAMAAGIDAVLGKPYTVEALLGAVARAVRTRTGAATAHAAKTEHEKPRPSVSGGA